MGSGGVQWDSGDVVGAARLNQKTVFVGTGAQINGATTYAGMHAYCTSSGSGFTADQYYVRNAANSSWVLSGNAENSVNKNVSGGYLGCDTVATAVHYQELGRTTLGGTATSMSVSSFSARKYLRLVIIGLYSATNLNPALQFNTDTGTNYAWRRSDNGGADTTSTSDSKIVIGSQSQQNQFMIV